MIVRSRYAVFYAPAPSDLLWQFGSAIIGYDAASGTDLPAPSEARFNLADWAALTEEPRRYGFHGTLKAPFHLAEDRSEDALLSAAADFATQRAAFTVSQLRVAAIGRFVALVPAEDSRPLDELAAECVRAFEGFRAPLTDADRQRRLASPLSERQRRHLDLWGYPYVDEEFRFHMTLTGPLPTVRREPIRSALAEVYAAIEPGLSVEAITIFRQEDRASRFRILARLPFGR